MATNLKTTTVLYSDMRTSVKTNTSCTYTQGEEENYLSIYTYYSVVF